MSDNPTPPDINRMMDELQDEWGNVYVCYRGPDFFDGEECTIRNTTDEGLPINVDKKEVTGVTFTDTLEKTYQEHVTQKHK